MLGDEVGPTSLTKIGARKTNRHRWSEGSSLRGGGSGTTTEAVGVAETGGSRTSAAGGGGEAAADALAGGVADFDAGSPVAVLGLVALLPLGDSVEACRVRGKRTEQGVEARLPPRPRNRRTRQSRWFARRSTDRRSRSASYESPPRLGVTVPSALKRSVCASSSMMRARNRHQLRSLVGTPLAPPIDQSDQGGRLGAGDLRDRCQEGEGREEDAGCCFAFATNERGAIYPPIARQAVHPPTSRSPDR